MRRWIVIALVVGLASSALGSPAGATRRSQKKLERSERVLHAEYPAPTIGSPSSPGWLCYAPITCPLFSIRQEERFATVEVEDSSGTATAFLFGQYTGDGDVTEYGNFCGSAGPKPMRLESGTTLVVAPYAFGDIVCPGSVGTFGTVKVTLSTVP